MGWVGSAGAAKAGHASHGSPLPLPSTCLSLRMSHTLPCPPRVLHSVRNFLKTQKAEFLALSEYTAPADAARARSYFFARRRPLLLLTERAQFYHRYRIRGIRVRAGEHRGAAIAWVRTALPARAPVICRALRHPAPDAGHLLLPVARAPAVLQ